MTMDIARHRLDRQFLTSPTLATAADVVRAQGAVQSQDFAGAKWALALRMRDATDVDIEQAFADGTIIRTHVLRPTWHFVAPEDLRWMLALTGPRVSAAMGSYNRKLELDAKVFRRSHAVIERALRGGRQLTRAELARELGAARIGFVAGQRLAHLVMQAELDAVICSGARRGKQFTYALVDERVAPTRSRTRDEALVELTRRYFATRSPASAKDFAWWSGLTVADANRGIQMSGTLSQETIDGQVYWYDSASPALPRRGVRKSTGALLLPNYDEYFIGYRDRRAIGQRLKSVQVVTGGDALVQHVVVVEGQLVGRWKRSLTRGGIALTVSLQTRLTAQETAAVDAAIQRYGAFAGVAVTHRIVRDARR